MSVDFPEPALPLIRYIPSPIYSHVEKLLQGLSSEQSFFEDPIDRFKFGTQNVLLAICSNGKRKTLPKFGLNVREFVARACAAPRTWDSWVGIRLELKEDG